MLDEMDERLPNSFEHFKAAVAHLDLDREWWAMVYLEDLGGRPAVRDGLQSARLVAAVAELVSLIWL